MDKKTSTYALPPELIPPKDITVSTILNGIGNGMSIGSIPLFINEFGSVLGLAKQPSPQMQKIGLVSTAIGTAVGCYFGVREAKHLKAYQLALARELTDVRQQIAVGASKVETLTEEHKAHVAAGDTSRRR